MNVCNRKFCAQICVKHYTMKPPLMDTPCYGHLLIMDTIPWRMHPEWRCT